MIAAELLEPRLSRHVRGRSGRDEQVAEDVHRGDRLGPDDHELPFGHGRVEVHGQAWPRSVMLERRRQVADLAPCEARVDHPGLEVAEDAADEVQQCGASSRNSRRRDHGTSGAAGAGGSRAEARRPPPSRRARPSRAVEELPARVGELEVVHDREDEAFALRPASQLGGAYAGKTNGFSEGSATRARGQPRRTRRAPRVVSRRSGRSPRPSRLVERRPGVGQPEPCAQALCSFPWWSTTPSTLTRVVAEQGGKMTFAGRPPGAGADDTDGHGTSVGSPSSTGVHAGSTGGGCRNGDRAAHDAHEEGGEDHLDAEPREREADHRRVVVGSAANPSDSP